VSGLLQGALDLALGDGALPTPLRASLRN